MVRDIMRDPIFLARKAEPAGPDDLSVGQDLLDTLKAHKDGCVGMAANMIGVNKRIIAIEFEGDYLLLYNPEIVAQSQPYQTEEGCLSLPGMRPVQRYGKIKVAYQNERMQPRYRTFTGFAAQIVQHEVDHCEGILI